MTSKPDLLVAPCSYQAAKYAVMRWHYSRTMPIGKIVSYGAWEHSIFIGAVLFARGNNPSLGDSYGLEITEVCELVRVALGRHSVAVSQIVSTCVKMLKKSNNGLRLVISFADPEQGHVGGIYQAMNWIYGGHSVPSPQWFHGGKWKHNREITSGAFGKQRKVIDYKELPKRMPKAKHRYLYPLDRAMRRQIEPLAQPYPKKLDARPVNGDTLTTSEAGRFDPDPDA